MEHRQRRRVQCGQGTTGRDASDVGFARPGRNLRPTALALSDVRPDRPQTAVGLDGGAARKGRTATTRATTRREAIGKNLRPGWNPMDRRASDEMNRVQDEPSDPPHPHPRPHSRSRAPHVSSGGGTEAAGNDPVEAEARAAFLEARHGRRSAYGTVVRLYHDRIYNAVHRLVRHHDDAAEVTQEAFAKGFEKLDRFRGDSGPYTWLFRIAMNAAVTRIRRGRRRKTYSLDALDTNAGAGWQTNYRARQDDAPRPGDSLADGGLSPDEAAELSEDHRAVLDGLGRLDAENRALLVMRDLEGFDYRQMAEILDLPMGTLKSRLFRARTALREQLQDHFELRRRRGADDE